MSRLIIRLIMAMHNCLSSLKYADQQTLGAVDEAGILASPHQKHDLFVCCLTLVLQIG